MTGADVRNGITKNMLHNFFIASFVYTFLRDLFLSTNFMELFFNCLDLLLLLLLLLLLREGYTSNCSLSFYAAASCYIRRLNLLYLKSHIVYVKVSSIPSHVLIPCYIVFCFHFFQKVNSLSLDFSVGSVFFSRLCLASVVRWNCR